MQTQFHLLLTLVVFLPAVGAIGLLLVPGKRPTIAKWVAAIVTGVVFLLTLALFSGKIGIIQHRQQPALGRLQPLD